jgi:S-adenosylmethionine-diacylglycerol 3-amino-3-carboxypropyl transferase
MAERPVSTTSAPRDAGLFHRFNQKVFNTLYNRSLLYNTCWEDPELDREAMALTSDDSVVVITSAGCNALDYAIDGPARVDAVDANPLQTALIELKLAGIHTLDFDDFFKIFGYGVHDNFEDLYRSKLRPQLSPASRRCWDIRRSWFNGRGWRSSLYFQGLSGLVARAMRTFINANPKLSRGIRLLLETDNLEDQRHVYDTKVAPHLWTRTLNWGLRRQFTMMLLGVPYPQRQEVQASHSDGVAGFVRSCLDYVCRVLPINTNYFWTVYLRGSYTPECCPRYLEEEHFLALKGGLANNVHAHTTTVTDFLKGHDLGISRFVLLDHMDWMGYYFPQALAEEWEQILERSTDQARVLFRSGSHQPDFLNQFNVTNPDGSQGPLTDRLTFHPEWASKLHEHDRVHTYASFHIADIDA